jgi:hypothetical protein
MSAQQARDRKRDGCNNASEQQRSQQAHVRRRECTCTSGADRNGGPDHGGMGTDDAGGGGTTVAGGSLPRGNPRADAHRVGDTRCRGLRRGHGTPPGSDRHEYQET